MKEISTSPEGGRVRDMKEVVEAGRMTGRVCALIHHLRSIPVPHQGSSSLSSTAL